MIRLVLIVGCFLNNMSSFCSPVSNSTDSQKAKLPGGFIVYAAGVDYYQVSRKTVFLLNTYTREWSSMADLPALTEGSQLFYADGRLLNAGGSGGPASFLMYNSAVPEWTSLPNLNAPVGFGVCGTILAGSLYLLGGSAQGRGTQVMSSNSFPNWTPGSQMQQARLACGAAVLGNYIYTCGHASTGADSKTCERYDPTSKSWSFVASMNDNRLGQILVAVDGWLYAVGGNINGTAERYDPVTNAWTNIRPATDHARTASAAVTDGKLIYMMGGCDQIKACSSKSRKTNTVEVYIPELDEWVVIPSLPEAREDAAIAYLPQLPK